MTKPVEPLSEFDALRRAGISYAQEASGEIWTDYNLHDPGVTLLEQTCFALSQIAYQVGRPTRDLLTNPRGHFCTQDMALFRPRKVLATSPVTRRDLAAWLCSCPGIDSVSIAPATDKAPGRFHITIVPSPRGDKEPDPRTAFRAAFADARPLCTRLERLEIARPVDVALHGTVEIGSETLPEVAAAALYHKIGQILTGADRRDSPATRADVWDAPERLLVPAQSRSEQSLDLSKHLARLSSLPGVRDIGDLTLKPLPDQPKGGPDPVYFRVKLPLDQDQIGLNLTMNGAPVTLHAARLGEEFIRISAEAIAEATHHIDRIDWDVMKPGRRRSFTHSHVDELLPVLYRAQGYRMHDPATLISEYRGAIDEVLRDMVDTLSRLPRTFTANPRRPEEDPVLHRRRIDLLDYLIALQGCDMPATRHTGLHRYMSTTARHRFEIEWRLEYLFALPRLHRARASAPGPRLPGGFLAELAILCDLGLSETANLTKPLQDYGLTLNPDCGLAEDPVAEDLMLIPAHDPFDMLVPEDDSAEPCTPDELTELSSFLLAGRLSPALLARLADPDSFAIAPYMGGQWLILLDPGANGALRRISVAATKQQAIDTVARLRATWKHINRKCEAAHLVEHVLIGAEGADAANLADLTLPGFTARCRMESYRSYVESLVDALAPAHLHIRVQWLTYDQMQTFEALAESAASGTPEDLAKFRHYLDRRARGGED